MPPKGWKKVSPGLMADDKGKGGGIPPEVNFVLPEGMLLVSIDEYNDLRKAKTDLEHALAREKQNAEPKPEPPPVERDFRCKLCKTKFRSDQRRPKCPQGCSLPFEFRTAHGDFVTTEPVA